MISKNRIKEIKQLELKKYRRRTGLFVAEGHKLVLDLLSAYQPVYFAATDEWLKQNPGALPAGAPCDSVTQDELQRASLQQNQIGRPALGERVSKYFKISGGADA